MNLRTARRPLDVAVFVSMWAVLLIAALWPAAIANAQMCEQVLPKLTASDGTADDLFGWSVSISGDTAIVGAHFDDDLGTNSGSAYVFVRSGTVWTQQQRLTASDGAANDFFGFSVSISGDTAIVGALFDDASSGSAYVFVRSGPPGEEVWTQQQKLTASDGAAGDRFGYSVSISQTEYGRYCSS